eukprot:UN09850
MSQKAKIPNVLRRLFALFVFIFFSFWVIYWHKSQHNSLQLTQSHYNDNTQNSINSNESEYFLIFQIGFAKMATTSLRNFFEMNNISSIDNYIYLQRTIKQQIEIFEPTFGNLTDKFRYFGDFGAPPTDSNVVPTNKSHKYLFEDILYYYPNSKFILNIRNVNTWLKSRYLHRLRKNWMLQWLPKFPNYAQQFKNYICYVINVFYNDELIRDNLLIFDIETDSIDKLI